MDCLWRGELCLDDTRAALVDIAIVDLGAEPDPDSDFTWSMPVTVRSPDVIVEEVYIHWAGGEIRSGEVAGKTRLEGELIRVSEATGLDTRLVIFEERVDIDLEQARERVYGMPYVEWKEHYQTPASAEQRAAFERNKPTD